MHERVCNRVECSAVSNQGLVWLFDHFPQQEATSTAFEQKHPEAFLLQNKNTLLPAGYYVRQRYERVQAVLSDGRATKRQAITPLLSCPCPMWHPPALAYWPALEFWMLYLNNVKAKFPNNISFKCQSTFMSKVILIWFCDAYLACLVKLIKTWFIFKHTCWLTVLGMLLIPNSGGYTLQMWTCGKLIKAGKNSWPEIRNTRKWIRDETSKDVADWTFNDDLKHIHSGKGNNIKADMEMHVVGFYTDTILRGLKNI